MNKFLLSIVSVSILIGCSDPISTEESEATPKVEVEETTGASETSEVPQEEVLTDREKLIAEATAGGYVPGVIEVYEERTNTEVEELISVGRVTADNWDEQKEALEIEGAEYLEVTAKEIEALLPGDSLTTLIEEAEEGDVLDPTTYMYLPDFSQEDVESGLIDPVMLGQMQQSYYGYIKVLKKYEEERTPTPKRVDSRHILIDHNEVNGYMAEEGVEEMTKEAAKAKALDLLAQLQGGADFAELAKEHSTGPSGPDGGELGPAADGMMVPTFNDALFSATEAGLIPDVIETDFGFHIIEINEILPEEKKMTKVVDFEMIAWPGDKPSWKPSSLTNKDIKSVRSEDKEFPVEAVSEEGAESEDQPSPETEIRKVLIFELTEEGTVKYQEMAKRLANKDTGPEGCAAGGASECQMVFLLEGQGLGAAKVESEDVSSEITLDGGYDDFSIELILEIVNGMDPEEALQKAQEKAQEEQDRAFEAALEEEVESVE